MDEKEQRQELTDMQIIARGLGKFFEDHPEKITYWLFTSNLNFGGFSPAQLMLDSERIKKVTAFVLSAQEVGAPE